MAANIYSTPRSHHRVAAIAASGSSEWPVQSRQGEACVSGSAHGDGHQPPGAAQTSLGVRRRPRAPGEWPQSRCRVCPLLPSTSPVTHSIQLAAPPPTHTLGWLSFHGPLEILAELPQVPSGASQGISSPQVLGLISLLPTVLVDGVQEDQGKASPQRRAGAEPGRLASALKRCGFPRQMSATGEHLGRKEALGRQGVGETKAGDGCLHFAGTWRARKQSHSRKAHAQLKLLVVGQTGIQLPRQIGAVPCEQREG